MLYSKPIENHAKKPDLIEINDRNEQIAKITEIIIDKLVKKEKVLPKNILLLLFMMVQLEHHQGVIHL